MKRLASLLGAVAFAAAATLIPHAQAQDLPKRQFKVVGTWSNLTNWQKNEMPWWSQELPAASKNAISAQIQSLSDLGLKGTEIMRMLKLGLFDFAHAIPIYVAEDAALEGIDLAGTARDFATARKITEVYGPLLADSMSKNYGARVLAWNTWPAQMLYCGKPIASLADIKGKKVRVQGVSQGDLVAGLGGTGVTIPFAEVVPALQRGTVDCGITGTMPAYKGGWHEVTTHVLTLPLGFTIGFFAVSNNTWNGLDAPTKAFLEAQSKTWTDRAWKVIEDENEMGLVCTSGQGGTCSEGKPGKLVVVKPSADDVAFLNKVTQETVLARWAKRCGSACVAAWNDSVGRVAKLSAAP
jgi:TRAP-type C4-dicarboxylate transport system substrate-binding protein